MREADRLVIRVKDNGIRIAPEVLPRVFDLFAQADANADRSQGGLGIGLALVRSLVERHALWDGARSAHLPVILARMLGINAGVPGTKGQGPRVKLRSAPRVLVPFDQVGGYGVTVLAALANPVGGIAGVHEGHDRRHSHNRDEQEPDQDERQKPRKRPAHG